MNTVDPHKRSSVCHFDWITVVFPVDIKTPLSGLEYVENLLCKLGITLAYEQMSYGIYTYECAIQLAGGSIIVGYDSIFSLLNDKNNTIMIQISGQGLETLESVFDNNGSSIVDFIDCCIRQSCNFTRIDCCTDFYNYGKEYSAKYIGEQAKQGNIVTRANKIKVIHSFSAQGADKDRRKRNYYTGSNEGYTTYIGVNPKQLRIYNKLAERSDKVNLLYQVDSWSRWEFQLNGQHAQDFIDDYVRFNHDLVKTWISWIAKNYRIIERVGVQVKRSRYPNATWFDALIQNAIGINHRVERQKPTYERSAKWIRHQVLPTLATMVATRYNKYLENNVSPKDARNLAIKYVIANDIQRYINADDVNETLVSAWLEEHNYDLV